MRGERMHRKNCVSHAACRSLVLCGLLLGNWAATARAADDAAAPVIKVTLPIGTAKQYDSPIPKGIMAFPNNPRPDLLRIDGGRSPYSASFTGLKPGFVDLTFTITTEDGKKETRQMQVVVQTDVEYLNFIFKRVVPTANIEAVPGPGGSIIIKGTVANAQDTETIDRIALASLGDANPRKVINAARVGGVQMVQLDVVVARVTRSEVRRMNLDVWNPGAQHDLTSVQGGGFNLPTPGTGISGNPLGAFTVQNTVGTPNGVPSNIFLSIFTSSQSVFLFLQALRDNNLAKLMAEPHVVTMSGKPANFLSGGDQAVPEVSGFGGTAGVRFVPFGTQLQVLPIVLGNGKIYLEIEPEVSALDPANGVSIGGFTVPGRSTQRVHTSVMLEDGQTFVIGGLIQSSLQGNTTKLPVLGDIPFLGAAFTRKFFQEVEEELVILVTPHLIDAMSCDQVAKRLPGQETRRPDDFELFLEGILEAPRGQREVWSDRHYIAAYKNDPTLSVYPCGLSNRRDCEHGCGSGCSHGGCKNGGCNGGACNNGGCSKAGGCQNCAGGETTGTLQQTGFVDESAPVLGSRR